MDRRTLLVALTSSLAACALRRAPGGAAAYDASFTSAPSAPPRAWRGLIGEYGARSDPETQLLLVFEQDGQLYCGGRGLQDAALTRVGPDRYAFRGADQRPIVFERRGDDAAALLLGDERLQRRDVGAEVQAQIQSGVNAEPRKLREAALAAAPPIQPPPASAHDLVPVQTFAPDIRLDVRYATTDNFMGVQIYECAAAYLQRPAAQALGRVQHALQARGYGLLVHDGYRPWFATKMFWDATPEHSRKFVADPTQGSRHNRGCAVDLTLYELASGHRSRCQAGTTRCRSARIRTSAAGPLGSAGIETCCAPRWNVSASR